MKSKGIFDNGLELCSLRKLHGLSQSKLAEITGIVQARISAYELGKNGLKPDEHATIKEIIEGLDEKIIQQLKAKRYRKHVKTGKIILSRPRRSYYQTDENSEYLRELAMLEKQAGSQQHNLKFKALSLFAGCGGLCYGIKAAGFRIVGVSEIYDRYRKIYALNFPEVTMMSNDVRKIADNECAKLIKKEGYIDLMAGGPPCQGFSLTGKRNPNDPRNVLFYDYLRIANIIKPKVVLMENVRLLTSMKDSEGEFIKKRILEEFAVIGYNAEFFCLNTKDYGIPQHRERVIFIAIRNKIKKNPSVPLPTHGVEVNLLNTIKSYRTFGDAVSDLEFIESGEKSKKDIWHFAISHPEHVIEWLVDVPQGKSAHENENPKLRPPSGYNTTYKRQVWNEPGSTVATTFSMISGSRNVHPIATRSITIREAMRLQSFPDSFKLQGTLGDMRTAIGNAVPPLFAYVLAKHILKNYIL